MDSDPFDLSNVKFPCSIFENDICDGFTKLHRYVMMTNKHPKYIIKIKKILAKHPHLLNMQNSRGWSPLMLAACNSNKYSTIETVELLLSYGPDLEIKTKNLNTALSLASIFGGSSSSVETVRLLLSYGADINNINKDGNSVLQWAILGIRDDEYGSIDVVNLLLDYNGHNQPNYNGHDQSYSKINLDAKNQHGSTALLIVARSSMAKHFDDIMTKLISCGADINAKTNDGFTPLMITARYAGTESSINSVRILVNAGADLNMKNSNGATALICAIHSENIESIRIIIDAGADLLPLYKGKRAIKQVPDNLKYDVQNIIMHRLLKLINNTDLGLECMICLDSDKINAELPCGHKFHNKCINEWLSTKNTCPVCRQEFF